MNRLSDPDFQHRLGFIKGVIVGGAVGIVLAAIIAIAAVA